MSSTSLHRPFPGLPTSSFPAAVSTAVDAVHCAIAAVRDGRAVALFDDHDREDECDLVIPADVMDEAMMALFIRECSGIVCLCLDDTRIRQLDLPPMVASNESRFRTAFTVSIEARQGVTTGVSAADRLTTIRAAIAPDAQPEDLVRPGHVFPLRAHPQGVLGRRGHTEGSVDLARLAGFQPAAVLCELMHPDGTMMRGREARAFAEAHDYPILSIAQIVQYRHFVEGYAPQAD